MFDVVFFVSICFAVGEMFYNVPALGPDRKHFIFYILNIYVCICVTMYYTYKRVHTILSAPTKYYLV